MFKITKKKKKKVGRGALPKSALDKEQNRDGNSVSPSEARISLCMGVVGQGHPLFGHLEWHSSSTSQSNEVIRNTI